MFKSTKPLYETLQLLVCVTISITNTLYESEQAIQKRIEALTLLVRQKLT